MTDASRTPRRRPQGIPGGQIRIAGIDGIGALPQVQLPVAPTANIEDRSQEFLARSQQSVQNAFDTQQQIIDSNARAAQAEAQARSRNPFASTLSSTVGALQAGLEMFQQVQQGRQDAERKQIAAQFEDEVRSRVVQLHREVGQNASDSGLIPTYTTMLRQLRQQYAGQLDSETLQTITNIGWDAITEVQREQGARWVNEIEDLQAQGRELHLNQLKTELSPVVNQLMHGGLSRDPNTALSNINSILGTYLEQNDMSGIDALTVLNGIYPFVQEAYLAAGADATQLNAQQDILTSVLQEASQINMQLSGNQEARDAALAPLQLILDNSGISGVTLTDVFRTDVQRLEQNISVQRNINALRNSQVTNPRLTPQASQAIGIMNAATALDWFNNPTPAIRREIEAARGSDATLDQKTQIGIYDDIVEARQTIRELNDANGQLFQQQRESLAEIEAIAADLDPTGELGQPTIAVDYINRLVQLSGTERGRISETQAQRLQELQATVFDEAQRRIDDNLAQIGKIHSDWLNFGIDIHDPQNTAAIDRMLAEAEPVLQDALRQQSSNSLSPPNFQLGLPPLPRR